MSSRHEKIGWGASRPWSVLLVLPLASLCAHAPAHGQSFDCNKAATAVEHTICASKTLSALDALLASTLKNVISGAPDDRSEMLSEERHWLSYRDGRCGHSPSGKRTEQCLIKVYQVRIEELNGGRFVLERTDPACATLQGKVLAQYPPQLDGVPDWKDPSISLSSELWGTVVMEADFDFYNDGSIARVFRLEFAAQMMSGSSLLVQPAPSSSTAGAPYGNPVDDLQSGFFPCQWANEKTDIKHCPPFGNAPELESFSVYQSKGAQPVEQFPIRFIDLVPVRVHDTTFVMVSYANRYPGTHTAVFRPNMQRKFELVCLLRDPPPGT